MNIGIFTDLYLPNIFGVTTSLLTVQAGLRKLGHNVFIIAPNDKLKYEAFPEKYTWLLPSIKFYGNKSVRLAVPLYFPKELLELPLDVVHTQTPFSIGLLGLKIARLKKIRCVHTNHGRYLEYTHYLKIPRSVIKPLEKEMIRPITAFINRHDAVIAPSSSIKIELESFGVKKPISVIPTGIDIEQTNTWVDRADKNQILKKFGLSEKNDLVVFTSRLGKEKNIEFLLEAFKIVADIRPQTRFIIMGDGDNRAELEKITKNIGLSDKIFFTGLINHEDIFPIYKMARVFVFASLTETQGLVSLEAMASGLPVVALKATGTEDLLVENRGGFLIEKHDPSIFAESVINLLEDENLHRMKSAEAHQRANDFSIEKTTKALVNVYQNNAFEG